MKTKHKSGFSLVEVMVASLILAALVVGGAAVLYQTGGGVQIAGNKRVAMEYARSEMEAFKIGDYFVLRASAPNTSVTKTETVNEVPLVITTDIILHGADPSDPDVGPLGNEYLELHVQVQYGRYSDEVVVMNSNKVL